MQKGIGSYTTLKVCLNKIVVVKDPIQNCMSIDHVNLKMESEKGYMPTTAPEIQYNMPIHGEERWWWNTDYAKGWVEYL